MASFITPKKELRTLAREVVREPDFRRSFCHLLASKHASREM
ncbi:MAG: hypothetical protein ACJZ70_14105 [Limisphaerales bacterium]